MWQWKFQLSLSTKDLPRQRMVKMLKWEQKYRCFKNLSFLSIINNSIDRKSFNPLIISEIALMHWCNSYGVCAIFHNVTQLCLYVELSLRMDRVGATWSVNQVASPCKLPDPIMKMYMIVYSNCPLIAKKKTTAIDPAFQYLIN